MSYRLIVLATIISTESIACVRLRYFNGKNKFTSISNSEVPLNFEETDLDSQESLKNMFISRYFNIIIIERFYGRFHIFYT